MTVAVYRKQWNQQLHLLRIPSALPTNCTLVLHSFGRHILKGWARLTTSYPSGTNAIPQPLTPPHPNTPLCTGTPPGSCVRGAAHLARHRTPGLLRPYPIMFCAPTAFPMSSPIPIPTKKKPCSPCTLHPAHALSPQVPPHSWQHISLGVARLGCSHHTHLTYSAPPAPDPLSSPTTLPMRSPLRCTARQLRSWCSTSRSALQAWAARTR